MSIVQMVKGKFVTFSHYKESELWYETECGFMFPVPINDCGNASFLSRDKAPLFMRYIKIHKSFLETSKLEAEST